MKGDSSNIAKLFSHKAYMKLVTGNPWKFDREARKVIVLQVIMLLATLYGED